MLGWICAALLPVSQVSQLLDSLICAFKGSALFHVVANPEITQNCQDVPSAEFALLVHMIDEASGLCQVKIDFTACH